jgi:hypothetical protein
MTAAMILRKKGDLLTTLDYIEIIGETFAQLMRPEGKEIILNFITSQVLEGGEERGEEGGNLYLLGK